MEKAKKSKELDCSEKSKSLNDESIYICNKCKDRLFVEVDGGFIECECRELRIAEDKLKASGLSEEFRKMRFDNFDYSKSIDLMNAFKNAKEYSKSFKTIRIERQNSIIFTGQVGSGKTHLGMAASNALLDASIGVIYMPYRNTITKLKQTVMDEVNYQKEMSKYKNAAVLFIDDLFKGKITESDVNIMYEIVDYRYLKGLPFIITTEKTIEDLIDIDEAIGSRLYEISKEYIVRFKGNKLNYRIYGS